jgi:UDP-N-acetylmuramyl pentapeptide phosphotransferase/UDP-N-acetylglucosamine-1-phosphate transferase
MAAPVLRCRALLAGTGALTAVGASAALRRHLPGNPADWQRRNYRGAAVSLVGGPAITVAAGASAGLGGLLAGPGTDPADRRRLALAAVAAGMLAGLWGRYDDVAGERDRERAAKGFAGHLRALRQGRLTAGVVKVAGIGTSGIASGWLLERAHAEPVGPVDVVVRAGIVAGTANLVNLLDLRPGRALKVVLLTAGPVVLRAGPPGSLLAGPVGAAAALLPGDLGERTMLGDAGANAVGAVLGVGLAAGTSRPGRAALLAGLVGLTAASEVVSFSRVIDRTPPLRWLDRAGRGDGISRRDGTSRPRGTGRPGGG